MRLLLEHGADNKILGSSLGTALQAATVGRSIAIVKLLLERGARIDAQGGHYGNALCAAAGTYTLPFTGSGAYPADVTQLLLDHGADVLLKGSRGEVAVIKAACSGTLGAVEILLEETVRSCHDKGRLIKILQNAMIAAELRRRSDNGYVSGNESEMQTIEARLKARLQVLQG